MALAAQQPVDRFEERQVCLAACQALRASSTRDARFAPAGEEAEAVFDERRLPQPGLARDRDEQPVPGRDLEVRLGEHLHFGLSADETRRSGRPSVR